MLNRQRKYEKEHILQLFDSYGFRDCLGHDLMMCQDFHDLLDNYITLKRRIEP